MSWECTVYTFSPVQPDIFGIFRNFGISTRIWNKVVWVWTMFDSTAWVWNAWSLLVKGFECHCFTYFHPVCHSTEEDRHVASTIPNGFFLLVLQPIVKALQALAQSERTTPSLFCISLYSSFYIYIYFLLVEIHRISQAFWPLTQFYICDLFL